jgi:hypothetical protein
MADAPRAFRGSRTLARLDATIKTLARPALGEDWRSLAAVVLVMGAGYGVCMGTFALTPERALMLVYAGVKVPLLIVATGLICLPGFFVMNTVLGLRDDFGEAVRAVLGSQAAFAAALCSLGPLTVFLYVCGIAYREAQLVNAGMFTAATAMAQAVLIRRYRALVARKKAHSVSLWAWVVLYAFVGIQMGWMLRPFVGDPGGRVTFFRDEPFSNAYLFVIDLILRR